MKKTLIRVVLLLATLLTVGYSFSQNLYTEKDTFNSNQPIEILTDFIPDNLEEGYKSVYRLGKLDQGLILYEDDPNTLSIQLMLEPGQYSIQRTWVKPAFLSDVDNFDLIVAKTNCKHFVVVNQVVRPQFLNPDSVRVVVIRDTIRVCPDKDDIPILNWTIFPNPAKIGGCISVSIPTVEDSILVEIRDRASQEVLESGNYFGPEFCLHFNKSGLYDIVVAVNGYGYLKTIYILNP